MWIGHRKEIRKLTFRALALRRIRSDEGLTLVHWLYIYTICTINSVMYFELDNDDMESFLFLYRLYLFSSASRNLLSSEIYKN